MYGIFAGQKDKRVRDAAWEYIKFMDSDEARKIFTDVMVEYGMPRSVSPSWLRRYDYSEQAALTPPEAELAFEESLRRGQPEPYGQNCQFIYPLMTFPIEQIKKEVPLNISMEARRAKIKAILDHSVEKANEKMIGRVTPEERSRRNLVGWFVVALGGVLFVYLIYYIFTSINSKRPPILTDSASTYKTRLAAIIVAPAVILVFMWDYYPLVKGSAMSFQDYSLMGNSKWVGISNFADILYDLEGFWFPLKNALYFCFLWLLMGFLPPLFLAVLLQEIPRGKILFRVLYYLPAVVSGVVILFMWAAIFDRSDEGILNRILGLLNIKPIQWLEESDGFFNVVFRMVGIELPKWVPGPSFAMFCVVFPSAWAHLGPGCIIYLAALKGIPDDLYEAADIDGATFWHKVKYIVIPYFKPLLVINLIGATIHGFKSGGAVLAMTGGGPMRTTHVIGYEIFERTFMHLNFGHGTAIAWVLGILLLSFTAYKMKILNRVEFRGTH
jgi:ABC-type sugar transport system permease subunit